MRRREFIAGIGGAMVWPATAPAQQRALPVVGVIHGGADNLLSRVLAAFRSGLGETGYVEGQNLAVEYHWLEGQSDRLPALVADLVRRRVAVIVAFASIEATLAAKAATTTIPIVFVVGGSPVKLGLVASLARPDGNLTGMSSLLNETAPKRLGLLHELLPKADRVAVLVNPSNIQNTGEFREIQDAASVIGLSIDVLRASTSRQIEEAFAMMMRERTEVLLVGTDVYFHSRRFQLATLAARQGIATVYSDRDHVDVGGLMSYGTDWVDIWHQIGGYAGQILKGTKPADLPVVQPTKFELVINLQTARALGIEVPTTLLARADEVIE
jgi:putative tryptophan/tyrosine transport system substrate-binding protein